MMIAKPTDADRILTLSIDCRAPRQKVFETWTEPEWLKKWFFVDDGTVLKIAEIDLKVGGRYALGMGPRGTDEVWPTRGQFKVVHTPTVLVYTWLNDGRPAPEETLVTTVFSDREGGGSRVDLNHGVFVDAGDKQKHEMGWRACLAQMEKLLER